jgi:hypothetical protein
MSKYLAGLSYAHTGSLAYPRRTRSVERVNQGVARAVLDLVHPGQFKTLPPSPRAIAVKGELMGVIAYSEMWETVYIA